jgi:hypothetical protein
MLGIEILARFKFMDVPLTRTTSVCAFLICLTPLNISLFFSSFSQVKLSFDIADNVVSLFDTVPLSERSPSECKDHNSREVSELLSNYGKYQLDIWIPYFISISYGGFEAETLL